MNDFDTIKAMLTKAGVKFEEGNVLMYRTTKIGTLERGTIIKWANELKEKAWVLWDDGSEAFGIGTNSDYMVMPVELCEISWIK